MFVLLSVYSIKVVFSIIFSINLCNLRMKEGFIDSFNIGVKKFLFSTCGESLFNCDQTLFLCGESLCDESLMWRIVTLPSHLPRVVLVIRACISAIHSGVHVKEQRGLFNKI
jgi:hypothetical protein